MTEDEKEQRAKELMSQLETTIEAVVSEMNQLNEMGNFIPMHWVLMVGCQEPSGDESMTTYFPRPNQPYYVSLGLIEYQSGRMKGQAAQWEAQE